MIFTKLRNLVIQSLGMSMGIGIFGPIGNGR